ncbi:hypothetical protein [Nocardia sp. NPDC056100]|uniref:hypothetical protein n=1 Tax=Nocardia sp. NPDC056100 TaxID=3345712 RepID=UPI0035DFBBA9
MTHDNTPPDSRSDSGGADLIKSDNVDTAAGVYVVPSGGNATPETRMEDVAARGPYLVLWNAATLGTFTVCRPDGVVFWHARFHADVVFDSAVDAAKAGALQAVWIAAKAREEWGADVATLRLTVANQGFDRAAIEVAAIASGLILELAVDPGTNPALAHPVGSWIDWWTHDLGTLIHRRQGLV